MRLYLEQISKWFENKTGIPQQIIHTGERSDIRYFDYDSRENVINMTIIADVDIIVSSISWSDEYGIGLNINKKSNSNGEKVHVILWSDSETSKDERGFYIGVEGALNGILVITNPDIKITGDVIKEMLGVV